MDRQRLRMMNYLILMIISTLVQIKKIKNLKFMKTEKILM